MFYFIKLHGILFAIANVQHMIDSFALYLGSSACLGTCHGQPLEKAEHKHKQSGFKVPETFLYTSCKSKRSLVRNG